MDLTQMGVQVAASQKVSGGEGADTKATEPKFGEIWNNIMSKNGGTFDKPREVKKTLGKDDFLKLMITQMKYQDPSKPFEMEKMGSELAQLSNMEQLQNLNTTLKQMVTKDQPLERLAMTNLIGKSVVVDRDRFPHTEGQSEALHFNLPQDAKQVSVAVVDSTGEVLFEQDMGAVRKGENSFNWDGKKANTMPAKTGSYSLMVKAVDAKGTPIAMPKNVNAPVVGVSYEGNEPVPLVGSANSPDKITLKQVVRIIDHGPVGPMGQMMIPGAIPLSQTVMQPQQQSAVTAVSPSATQPGNKNFFTFEKGMGSTNVDPSKLNVDARRALEVYEQQAREAAEARDAEAASESGEKGFPNGLSEGPDAAALSALDARAQAENTDFARQ